MRVKYKFVIPNIYCLLRGVIRNIYSLINSKRVLKIFQDVTSEEYSHQIKTIKNIDRCMIGRYCGSIEDKIMQTMSCYDVASKFPSSLKYAHVEIGVLFGGSILAKLSILQRLGISQTVIAIDPFEGYYQKPKDPLTGIEVTEENFIRNIEKFGFERGMVRIIRKYSSDKDVKPILSEYNIISLMIDGDHSYEGVQKDWEMYSDLVEPGGHVIFDDYGDIGWPGVTGFVNELINSKPRNWEVFGKLDTTLILKHT